MKNADSLVRLGGGIVLLATLWALPAFAYDNYSADPVTNTGNCATCHGDYNGGDYSSLKDGTAWGQNLMNGHNSFIDGGFTEQCQTCHITPGSVPVATDTSGGPIRVQGCAGCHGRDEDVTPNDGAFGGPTPGRADGLRAHHASAGITVCSGCHSADAVQVGEDVEPFNFRPGGGNVLALTDACMDAVFGPTGLDNDGDGLDDGDDPDCIANQAPTADPDGPYTAQVGDTVTFDGSGSTDDDGTIVSYDWDFGDGTAMATGAMPTHTYGAEGTYTVELTVTDDMGATDTATTTATITAQPLPPIADPNGPYSGLVADTITFDGSGSSDPDGTIVSFAWDFGDGTAMGAGVMPTHTYGAAGTYTVGLTVTDDTGATDTATTTATITAQPLPPIADPNGPYSGQVGDTITFDGSGSSDPDGTIVSYAWDFGDGSAGTGAMPTHAYNAAGTFTVGLTVTDDTGATDTATTTATITAQPLPPIADPNGPYTGQVGDTITFDGSGSSDPDGTIVSYAWDFGDGSAGTGAMPTHAYNAAGTFTVGLTVTDDTGATDTATTTATITAQPLPPIADPNGPYTGQVGDTITFDGSGSSDPDGTIVSYAWDFGDGSAGTGAMPTHAYNAAGTFTVGLTVTDDTGATDTATTTATITAQPLPPIADPNGPYSGQVGDTITFDGSGSSDPDGTIVSYAWDFGDGSAGTGAMPTHAYNAAGTFTVGLTVTDDTGATDTATTTATITAQPLPPIADPNGPYSGQVGDTITFDGSGSSDPDGTIVSYAWDFGDGSAGTGAMPTHAYNAAGTFTVGLTVTDDTGATDTATTTATITAQPLPPIADPNGPYTGQVGDTITFDGSGSSDPDGTIVSYAWDFGDGSTGTGAMPTHAYSSAGTFTVTLTVTDDGTPALTGSATSTATITDVPPPNEAPIANANGPYTAQVGDTITFDGSGSSDPDGTIVSYAWDFGDGSTGTGAMPTHAYSSAGTFTVTLTVTDDGTPALTGSATSTATITDVPPPNEAPIANANGPYTAQVGDTITFDGSGSSDPDGTIVSYAWDFGDGNTGTGAMPTHAYSSAGTFTVTLTVTDDGTPALTGSATSTATITDVPPPNEAPIANANGPYTAQVGDTITFDGSGSSDPDGTIVRYDWDFGDGSTAFDGGTMPSHAYVAEGVYTVVLAVTDDLGALDKTKTKAAIKVGPPIGGGQGCTPRYWKQKRNFDSWTAPYTPQTKFGKVFDNAFRGDNLRRVVSQHGGGLNALGRQTVAALLNAASADVSYDLTVDEVISAFNDVYPGSKRDYRRLTKVFRGFNQQGCPLNAGDDDDHDDDDDDDHDHDHDDDSDHHDNRDGKDGDDKDDDD